MIIALIGFMGTGKSSVGLNLAAQLGFDFFDTDQLIVEESGREISRIFAEDGEEKFRQLESSVLQEIVKQERDCVLATGGGIVISRKNREILQDKTIPILLTASVEEIIQRVEGEGRPLLAVSDREERIRVLLEERQPWYQEFNNQVKTDNKEIIEIVSEIVELIEA